MSSLKEQRAKEKLKKQQCKAEREGVLTPAQELYNKGNDFYKAGNLEQALNCYNQAIQLNTKLAEAYGNRGNIYIEQENYEQALKDFNQVIKINPNSINVYYSRGLTYFKQKNYEQALNDFNQAIKIDPSDVEAYNSCGLAYFKQKNYEQALSNFNQAIKLNIGYAEAYNNRGVVYFEQKDYRQALNDFNQAIKLNFNHAEAYNNCGRIYFEQKNYKKALEHYNQAIKFNPSNADIYYNRGLTYAEQKNYEQALKDFKQAIICYKDNLYHVFNSNLTIQTLYLQIKDFEKAREYVEKAFESINFEGNQLLNQLPNIYLQNIDNAEKLHKAQKRNENLLRSYTHTLGNTLFPENVLAVIESLKQKSSELRKEILQLYGIYQAETTIRQQGELLRIRYMTNNPDEFVFLIQQSCLSADSNESGTSIENVFNQALESIVSRFLNLNYGKLELSRNCLNLDWKALKENFEQQIYFEHQNIIEWANQHLMNIELIFETDKWQQVRFKPQEHAEALFFEYFNELLLNTFKYADFKQGLQIRFYMQPIENINYLYCEWQNTCRENITSGSQIGLENLKEDLSQLNQSTTPESTVQMINENNLFKITLAFNKNLILFDPHERDQKREQNIDRWFEEEEEEDAHLVG